MPDRLVVVTGAASNLGRALIAELARRRALRIAALVRTRDFDATASDRVRYVAQNLLEPLTDECAELMRSADSIVHLAWARPGPATPAAAAADSTRMLDRVLSVPDAGRRLVFMSSVAASPRAPGHYARSKHEAQMRVLAAGGRVIVCGLIVGEPPETAFKLLVDVHRKLPVAFRLMPNRLRVYPVLKTDVVALLAVLATADAPAGAYRGFAGRGVPINDFVRWILERYGLRRPRIPMPVAAIGAATAMARLVGRDSLAEKLATFFFKDPTVLEGLVDPPEATLSASETQFGQLTG